MRYLLAGLLTVALVSSPLQVQAQDADTGSEDKVVVAKKAPPKTISGAMIGFGVDGEHSDGGMFASYFVGLNVTPARLRAWSPNSNLFLAGQRVSVASGGSGVGLKLVLQNQWTGVPELSTLLDIGFASNVAEGPEGDMETGVTVGGGLSYMTGDVLGFYVYGNGVDTGEAFDWWLAFGIVGVDLTEIFGL